MMPWGMISYEHLLVAAGLNIGVYFSTDFTRSYYSANCQRVDEDPEVRKARNQASAAYRSSQPRGERFYFYTEVFANKLIEFFLEDYGCLMPDLLALVESDLS